MAVVQLASYPIVSFSPGPTRTSPTELDVSNWGVGTRNVSDDPYILFTHPTSFYRPPSESFVLRGTDLYADSFEPSGSVLAPWTPAQNYGGTVEELTYQTSGPRGPQLLRYTISDLDVPLADLVGYQGNVIAFLLSGDDAVIGHDPEVPVAGISGPYDGAETLYGFDGDDVLLGLGGDDVLVGGAGADKLVGGDGFDVASYATATAGVYVHTGDVAQNAGDAAGDTYEGVEGLVGSDHDDTLITTWSGGSAWGGAGDDVLVARGEAGTTMLLQGETGNDVLYGGLAMDELVGGDGDDSAFGYEGDDVLRLGAGDDYALGGAGNDVVLMDGGDDEAHGGSGSDVLVMGAGDDLAFGDEGDDRIDLGTGNDFALGGRGADTFVFTAGQDRIGDFEAGRDRIELSSDVASSFDDILAAASEWMGTTYLSFANGDGIVIEDTSLASLTRDDFLFV